METIKVFNDKLLLSAEFLETENVSYDDYYKTFWELETTQLLSSANALISFLLDEGFILKSRILNQPTYSNKRNFTYNII